MSTKIASFPALKTAAADGVSSGPAPASCGTAFDGTQAFAANCYTLPLAIPDVDTMGLQVSMPSTSTGQYTIAAQGSNYPYDARNPSSNSSVTGPQANASWSTLSFWDDATGSWQQSKTLTNAATTFMLSFPITQTAGTAPVRLDMHCKSDGH